MTKLVNTFKSVSQTSSVSLASGSPVIDSVLLMHFDGANGSTTFTDVYGHTFTATASGTITTAQSKFGGASATCSGTIDAVCNGTASTDFDFLTGDFTIESWVNRASSNRIGVFSTSSSKGAAIGAFGNTVFFGAAAVLSYTASFSFSANTWYAIAWVRSSGVSQLYVNGVATGSANTDTYSYHPSLDGAFTTNIGQDSQLSGGATPGYIDELRISKVARYTANYTPASSAFTY